MNEAKQYAVLYPGRARRIRAEGGLLARLDYGPPEPHVVDAIVNGTSPTYARSTGNLPSVPRHETPHREDKGTAARQCRDGNRTLRRRVMTAMDELR